MSYCDDRDPRKCSNRVGDQPCVCPCHTPQQEMPEAVRVMLSNLLREQQTQAVEDYISDHPQYAEAFVPLLTDFINGVFGGGMLSPEEVFALLSAMGMIPGAQVFSITVRPDFGGQSFSESLAPFQKGEKLH